VIVGFFDFAADVGYRKVFDVGLVQRRVHGDDRSIQGRRSGEQAGGVELQCLRDGQRPRTLRDDTRCQWLARREENFAIQSLRREVRDGHLVRVDRRVPENSRRERW